MPFHRHVFIRPGISFNCFKMSGPVNKFYHPGACRLVDAYFRLNVAWWVYNNFYVIRSSVFDDITTVFLRRCLRSSILLRLLSVAYFQLNISWVPVFSDISASIIVAFNDYLSPFFMFQFSTILRRCDHPFSSSHLYCSSRWDGRRSSSNIVLHEPGCSDSSSLTLFGLALPGYHIVRRITCCF